MVALAGPNGAGKSTFYDAHLARTGLYFVNADILSASLGLNPYRAAELAETLRRQLIERRESFIFETVFSDPGGEKLRLMKEAQSAGYTVLLTFIGIDGPEASNTRVAMRAASGGHDVPRDKLVERFPRVMRNLQKALSELQNIRVYDNSDFTRPYRLVAIREDGGEIKLHDPVPEWLHPLLPK
jgi:predicted ABC-type ATPase